MLTPEDVVNQRFAPTRFRAGYDHDEVDAFLDQAAAALRGNGPAMTPQQVRDIRFTLRTFVEGYDQEQVDRFLDLLVQSLEAVSAPPQVTGCPVPAHPPASGPQGEPLGLRALTAQLQHATVRTQGADGVQVRLADGGTVRVMGVDAGPDDVTLLTR